MDQHPSNWLFFGFFLPAFFLCMFGYYANAKSEPLRASIDALPQSQNPDTAAKPSPANRCVPFSRFRQNLVARDSDGALEALHQALSQVGDGSTYVWERPERFLRGLITPTSSFRDANGRICRHVIYTLELGAYRRQAEGIACRDSNRKWALTG